MVIRYHENSFFPFTEVACENNIIWEFDGHLTAGHSNSVHELVQKLEKCCLQGYQILENFHHDPRFYHWVTYSSTTCKLIVSVLGVDFVDLINHCITLKIIWFILAKSEWCTFNTIKCSISFLFRHFHKFSSN